MHPPAFAACGLGTLCRVRGGAEPWPVIPAAGMSDRPGAVVPARPLRSPPIGGAEMAPQSERKSPPSTSTWAPFT